MVTNEFSGFKRLFTVAAIACGLSGGAQAGSIFLTGHDDDFHRSAGANAQVAAALVLVRAGSTLPVLTFDAGSQLTTQLTALGVPFFNVNPTAANVTDALFNPAMFSAFAVASVTTCGGCDNPVGTGLILASHSTAIASFFNAGRGILGLAGATDPNAYAYVPTSATNAGGSPPSSGYVQTAQGAALGIGAVNGDATHNFFSEPGTGGLSALYQVVERLGSATTGTPESIALVDGMIICTPTTCVIDPGPGGRVSEPGTLALMSLAMAGLAGVLRRRHSK